MRAIGFIVLAVALYFGLKTEAPAPGEPWLAYALNKSTGKLEWTSLASYKSLAECNFNADKAIRGGYYQAPSGCLYMGYQNPYIQWMTNTVLGNGMFRCIARQKARERFNDFLYSPVLRDYPSDHSDTWDCVVSG